MDIFKISDVYGIIAAMLALVLVYLVLKNGGAANMLVSTTASSGNTLLQTLQGR